eukprot:2926156-Pleurochrysis_carterae.AAC.1
MDGDARDRPPSPPAASAKRSLRAAIDGTPERPDPGRSRGNDDGPSQPDSISPASKFGAYVVNYDSTAYGSSA